VKMHGTITLSGRQYVSGDDVPWFGVYPFFLVHMLAFAGSGFIFCYLDPSMWSDLSFVAAMYLWGGLSILCYLPLYGIIFGRDELKWMFVNAGLGIVGIVSQIDWLLSLFGRGVGDYPIYAHGVPLAFFVMYTFLLRHAFLDLFGAREDATRRKRVQYAYVGATLAFYLVTSLLEG
jgi:hypothetical protein